MLAIPAGLSPAHGHGAIHQIADGASREVVHIAKILDRLI